MRDRVIRIEAGLIVGVILLVLGLLWTLDNLGFVYADSILRWWPALLVAWGVARIFGFGGCRRPVAGGFLVLIGSLLLVGEIRALPFVVWDLWPIALIVLGASIIARARRGPLTWSPGPGVSARPGDEGLLRSVAVWAGVERRVDSQAFRGGEAVALMGGLEVDLRHARVAGDEAVIDVMCVMGGVELFVPPDWHVNVEAVPLMGAVEDARRAPPTEAKNKLRVRGFVLMGGLEINDSRDGD